MVVLVVQTFRPETAESYVFETCGLWELGPCTALLCKCDTLRAQSFKPAASNCANRGLESLRSEGVQLSNQGGVGEEGPCGAWL